MLEKYACDSYANANIQLTSRKIVSHRFLDPWKVTTVEKPRRQQLLQGIAGFGFSRSFPEVWVGSSPAHLASHGCMHAKHEMA